MSHFTYLYDPTYDSKQVSSQYWYVTLLHCIILLDTTVFGQVTTYYIEIFSVIVFPDWVGPWMSRTIPMTMCSYVPKLKWSNKFIVIR